jgi:hypothetical protein
LLLAFAPCAFALALGAFLLAKGWVRPLAATLVSLGLAWSALALLVVVSIGVPALSHLGESPFLLLGIPVVTFAIALVVLLKRARVPLLTTAACAVFGLGAFYGLAGFVMMQSACSLHSGGC